MAVTDEDLVAGWQLMLLLREFDQKAVSLQRQGRLGTLSTSRGQEAAIAGAVMALDPARDWVIPQYRELTALTRHGFPLSNVFSHYLGNPGADRIPDGVRMLPVQISLAAQIPHAVGLAWGERLQGTDSVSLVFFGDGASSEGDFHESCNLAGVVDAPVIFFLQNNGWAISTPRSRQTAAKTFASRADGYGIHGEYVDGNDLHTVLNVTRAAVDRARSGGGATLVEAHMYRLGAHSTADDPTRYVPADELAAALERDPLESLQRTLVDRGLIDADHIDAAITKTRNDIAAAWAEAQDKPQADLADLLSHVYATPPQRLVDQIARHRADR